MNPAHASYSAQRAIRPTATETALTIANLASIPGRVVSSLDPRPHFLGKRSIKKNRSRTEASGLEFASNHLLQPSSVSLSLLYLLHQDRVASLSGICSSATIVVPYQIAVFFTCLVILPFAYSCETACSMLWSTCH